MQEQNRQDEIEYDREYYDCVLFVLKWLVWIVVIIFVIKGCLCKGH